MFGVEENFGDFGKSLVTCQILPSNSNNVSCDIKHYLKCLQVVSVYSKVFRSQVGRSNSQFSPVLHGHTYSCTGCISINS